MAASINTGTMGSAILQKGDHYLMLDNVRKEGGTLRPGPRLFRAFSV